MKNRYSHRRIFREFRSKNKNDYRSSEWKRRKMGENDIEKDFPWIELDLLIWLWRVREKWKNNENGKQRAKLYVEKIDVRTHSIVLKALSYEIDLHTAIGSIVRRKEMKKKKKTPVQIFVKRKKRGRNSLSVRTLYGSGPESVRTKDQQCDNWKVRAKLNDRVTS